MTDNVFEDRDTGFIIVAALRYSIGRMTYAPSLVSDWIRRYWGQIDKQTKHILMRDLKEELDRAKISPKILGHKCDQETWICLYEWMGKQKEQ